MRLRRYGMFTRAPPVPQMPEGLVDLMEGLTKEVLEHNPNDVYEFCASHMEQLLIIRDGRAPNKHLTLEQKIKRAQGLMREKAEQRRRKYDEDMKLLSKDVLEENKVKDEVVSNEVKEIRTSNEEAKYDEEIPAEFKLKAPVHHEKELTEAGEVEIFHKVIKGTSVTDATRVIEEVLIAGADRHDVKVEAGDDGVSIYRDSKEKEDINLDSTASDTDGILENNKSSSMEDNVIENNSDKASPEHTRAKQSTLSIDNFTEIEQVIANDSNIIKALEDNTNKSADFTEIIIDTVDTAPAEKIEVKEDNSKQKHTNENEIDQIDNATLFALEMSDAAPVKEKVDFKNCEEFIDSVIVSTENIGPVVDKHSVEKTNKSTESSHKTTVEDQEINTSEIESKVEDLVIDNFNETHIIAETIQESLKFESDVDENSKDINENQLTNDIDDREKEIIPDEKQKIERNSATEVKDTETSNVETTLNNEVEVTATPVQLNLELIENISNYAEKTALFENEEKYENDTNKPAYKIQESDTNQGYDKDVENYRNVENNNGLSHQTAIVGDEPSSQDSKNDIESNTDNNDDGTITTVNKVLVDESTIVQDDNESVPQVVETENIDIKIENVNGNHDATNGHNSENGTETPELEEISHNVELCKQAKKDENISAVQDSVSTTSDIKTNTSSMDKSSSMDDSITDENNDKITEVDANKSKPVLNKDAPSMDLETAAITIQKVFRSFLFKSRGSTFDDTGIDDGNLMDDDNEKVEVDFPVTSTPLNKERRTLGISRMDTVLQTVNEEKSLSLSTDDSSLSSAATIIQAHVRGFLVRNRLNSNKTNSTSLVNSDGQSTSLEADGEPKANKTVLNIHIVPEGQNFLNRDESLLTSIDLPLDGSPPSSVNLHPLGYDKSEPRKQLKREDAIQSISPPSNNSGKLSEDVDSVKDMLVSDSEQQKLIESIINEPRQDVDIESRDDTPTRSTTIETVIEAHKISRDASSSPEVDKKESDTATKRKSLPKMNSDESDVVTPYEEKHSTDSDDTSRLLHSGEFHDVVLPTKVSRSDTTVVREFKNVLAYFLIWNNS